MAQPAVDPLNCHCFILANIVPPNRQEGVVRRIIVRTVQRDAPGFQPLQQPVQRGGITTATFPVDEALARAIKSQPDPQLVLFFKNGRTGCLLKVSGGSRVKRAGDVPTLVSCEVGRRADPGSAPVCLSGMRPGDADPLQQPSGDRVAAGFGSPAPEDPAL